MRRVAQIVSILFHPLFMVTYVLGLVMIINPYLFSVQDVKTKGLIMISTFLLATFFPLLSISMMRVLGLVQSFQMEDRKDRIGPLIVTIIFYLWLYLNIKNNPGIPAAFSFFVLGTVIALFLAFFLNIFQRISLHAIGVGGLLVGIVIIGAVFSYGNFVIDLPVLGTYKVEMMLVYLIILLVTGLVLTARLLLGAHRKDEVYGGFFVGAISQVLAYLIFI